MPMSDKIRKILAKEEITPLHGALLIYCENLLQSSRRNMAQHYGYWDQQANVYMRRLAANKEDIEAVKQGLPRRIGVPMGYSQVDTFVAAGMMLFTQRERFFEMTPVEGQDNGMRECCELVQQRDHDATNGDARLMNNLLNVGRFGLGAEVDWWDVETAYIPVTTEDEPPTLNGIPTRDPLPITKLERVTKREGNCIRTISPYRIFPDPGFHLADWQRGSFIGWDDEFAQNALLGLDQDGVVSGIKHVTKYDQNRFVSACRCAPNSGEDWTRFSGVKKNALDKSSTIIITQIVINLIPNDIKVDDSDDSERLGKEEFPHKWLIWLANDMRVVRAEPLPNAHASWPVSLSFFAPDQHETILNSLSYMIEDLQGLVSWHMNSRVAAVSRTIDNQFLVDPQGVQVDDLVLKKRIIRLQKGAGSKGIDRYIQQLQTQDTTTGHVGDMQNLIQMIQLVSGVNDNAMGQYNGGRRSATESRTVNQGAMSRMKKVFQVMWKMHYVPQANRTLINARQEMSLEEFASICGEDKAQAYYAQFHAPVQQLARSYDYIPFDGTQPTEKQFIAQQLMELMQILMSNPQTALAFNMDPQKVLSEILALRGIHATAFEFDPVLLQQMQAQMQQLAQMQAQQPAPAPQQ